MVDHDRSHVTGQGRPWRVMSTCPTNVHDTKKQERWFVRPVGWISFENGAFYRTLTSV